MGNLKAVVPIAISLVIAIAGSFFIYQWIQKQTVSTEIVKMEAEAVPVLVAKTDIGWGTKLNPEMVTTAPYFKEALPPNYLTKYEEVPGRIVISPIRRGEPVVKHRLAPQDLHTGGVSAILKDGHRAIAVKGDKVIGISGFIKPGDRVDVLVSVKKDQSSNTTERTKIVLQNILVLATGTQVEEGEDRKPHEVDVYTLEVTPEQAEKLTLAATEGKIQLALRGLIDTEEVQTMGATIASTLALSNPQPQPAKTGGAPQPARRWVPKKHTVEIIKGTTVSDQKFDM